MDEEGLNAVLRNQTIRTGKATIIVKTNPRHSTVGRQPKTIVLLPPENWGETNEALNRPATQGYFLLVQGTSSINRHSRSTQTSLNTRGKANTRYAPGGKGLRDHGLQYCKRIFFLKLRLFSLKKMS